MIAMWGSHKSGKTTFLIGLYYEVLERRKKLHKDWKMYGVDEHSDDFIVRGFHLFAEARKFPERTNVDDLRPLRFSIRRPLDHYYDAGDKVQNWISKLSRHFQRSVGSTVQDDLIDFLDPSGEYFTDPVLLQTDQGASYRTALMECDGLLCLVDPERTDGAQFYFPLLYRNFAMLSRLMNGEGNPGPVPVPVAVCITKADQYVNAFDDPRAFLEQHMGSIDFSVFDTFCDDVRFFATSAVGVDNVEKTENGFVPLGPPKPVNVLEPIEWLMSRGATLR